MKHKKDRSERSVSETRHLGCLIPDPNPMGENDRPEPVRTPENFQNPEK